MAGYGFDENDGSDTAAWMARRQQDIDNRASDDALGREAFASAIQNGDDLSAPTTDSVRALGANLRAQDAAAVSAVQPIRRGDKGVLTDEHKVRIIFNETRSLSGPALQTGREYLAHAITNGDETWGPERARHAGSAPTIIPGGAPKVEMDAYQSAMAAVAAAKAQRAKGLDPTNGALNFNFRTPTQSGSFEARTIKTHLGPFNNSYPTKRLPAKGVYSNTY